MNNIDEVEQICLLITSTTKLPSDHKVTQYILDFHQKKFSENPTSPALFPLFYCLCESKFFYTLKSQKSSILKQINFSETVQSAQFLLIA